MKRVVLSAIGGFLLAAQLTGAKTPAQLKQEIASILPTGKKVRMVWSEVPKSVTTWTVYAYDSDEGVIRELTPASLFPNTKRNIPNAVVTQDGAQVVFKEALSGRIYLIDFDGRNLKMLLEYGCISKTWQDPVTKAQYAMIAKLDEAGTWLVSLKNPTDRRQIYKDELCDEEVGGTDGVGISVDGKRIGAFLCDSRSGIAATPSGSPVCGSCGGCNFSMRPVSGTAYEYTHFPNGHEAMCLHRADGSIKGELDNASTVVAWAKNNVAITGGEPVVLLWTNNPDFVSYQWGGWSVNPILFCISSKKWVAMRDNLTATSVNRFNAVFLPAGPESTGLSQHGRTGSDFSLANTAQSGSLYSIAGRLLPPGCRQADRLPSGPGISVTRSSLREGALRLSILTGGR